MLFKRCANAATLLLAGACSSCTTLTGIFDPGFLSALGAGSRAASLPGDAPALLVAIENRTANVIGAFVSYRIDSDVVETFTAVVEPGEKTAQALICPVSEITLGDVSDLDRFGVIVRLGEGNPDDPFIEVEPFGVLLREGANYDCGDSVTFAVVPSGATRSGFQTFAFIRRAP